MFAKCCHLFGCQVYGFVSDKRCAGVQERRLKFLDDHSSVLVRLIDEQRANLAPPAATSKGATITTPKYASKIEAQMLKPLARATQVCSIAET